MGDYRLQAFHDQQANPIATSYVQTSRCIDEWAPKLAEEAGLGQLIGRGYSLKSVANLQYENGSILVHKENRGGMYGERDSYPTGP